MRKNEFQRIARSPFISSTPSPHSSTIPYQPLPRSNIAPLRSSQDPHAYSILPTTDAQSPSQHVRTRNHTHTKQAVIDTESPSDHDSGTDTDADTDAESSSSADPASARGPASSSSHRTATSDMRHRVHLAHDSPMPDTGDVQLMQYPYEVDAGPFDSQVVYGLDDQYVYEAKTDAEKAADVHDYGEYTIYDSWHICAYRGLKITVGGASKKICTEIPSCRSRIR